MGGSRGTYDVTTSSISSFTFILVFPTLLKSLRRVAVAARSSRFLRLPSLLLLLLVSRLTFYSFSLPFLSPSCHHNTAGNLWWWYFTLDDCLHLGLAPPLTRITSLTSLHSWTLPSSKYISAPSLWPSQDQHSHPRSNYCRYRSPSSLLSSFTLTFQIASKDVI